MKRILLLLTLGILTFSALTGCSSESWDRTVKDHESSVNGLKRTATVYDQNGKIIKTYKGKFDVEVNDYGNKVKFDIDGKRVVLNNAIVIVEEDKQ